MFSDTAGQFNSRIILLFCSMRIRYFFSVVLSLALWGASCGHIDMYEKTVTIPGHAWKSDFKPVFDIAITDTASSYKVYLVLRHTEKYGYNNIYLNLGIQGPGQDSVTKIRREVTLASNDRWRGEGMDDIYEHREVIGQLGDTRVLTPGIYHFTLEQIMREDPLEHVLDVGVRVEKQPQ